MDLLRLLEVLALENLGWVVIFRLRELVLGCERHHILLHFQRFLNSQLA
jgi:hypothetical protein